MDTVLIEAVTSGFQVDRGNEADDSPDHMHLKYF